MRTEVTIDRRFRGPPDSGNGGYVCGLLAGELDGVAEVTLRIPPPLERTLAIERRGDGVGLLDGEALVAEGRPATLALDLPGPVGFEEARAAATRYPWRDGHPYPSCFVCGPERSPGADGLCIYPGPVDDGTRFAASWTPDASLGDARGQVRPEFLWAALDCPSGIVTDLFGGVGRMLLGRLTAELHLPVATGERCVVQAWSLERDGRKLHTASALQREDGEVVAVARAVWIEVEPA